MRLKCNQNRNIKDAKQIVKVLVPSEAIILSPFVTSRIPQKTPSIYGKSELDSPKNSDKYISQQLKLHRVQSKYVRIIAKDKIYPPISIRVEKLFCIEAPINFPKFFKFKSSEVFIFPLFRDIISVELGD